MSLESGSQKINILGSPWTVIISNADEYPALAQIAGYADTSTREIIVDDMNFDCETDKKDLKSYRNRVIRHEVIHAFLAESGLDGNGLKAKNWEHNEEMVDWFAIQIPKIAAVYMELEVM